MGKYFGTDGIRGEAYQKLNSELAFRVGQAIGHTYHPESVVIGMDTRASSPMLAYSIANGLMAIGINVHFAGVTSTPMIAYYSHLKKMIGVMITASHNPYQDNGIKIFKNGYKSIESDELIMESFIDQGELEFKNFGQMMVCSDVKEQYLKFFNSLNLPISNLKIIYDSANGANVEIAQTLMKHYAPNSLQINQSPDGFNINEHCGSTHPEGLMEKVRKEHADLGFAFDGDGDRMLAVNEKGELIDGDQIIYLIATYLKQHHLLNNNKVVLTKMSNPGILQALNAQNIGYVLTDVGDKYVFEALYQENLSIGGESSGHVILPHILHTGDGLLVALYLLKILSELNTTLDVSLKDIQLYPFKLTNIKHVDKTVLKSESVQKKIKEIKTQLGEPSLILVRPSGTENLIRVTLSAHDENLVDSLSKELISFMEKEGNKK